MSPNLPCLHNTASGGKKTNQYSIVKEQSQVQKWLGLFSNPYVQAPGGSILDEDILFAGGE